MANNNNQKKDFLKSKKSIEKSYLIRNNQYFICSAFCPVQAYTYPTHPLRN